MSIEYDFYRNPNSQGTNKKRYHARVVSSNRVSTNELAKEIQSECSLTIADVKAVLIALGGKLAKHLGKGSKVYLEGIGYFQVNLHCKEEVRTPHAIRSENVEFKSVSYRADNELKKHLREQKIQRSHGRNNRQDTDGLFPHTRNHYPSPVPDSVYTGKVYRSSHITEVGGKW